MASASEQGHAKNIANANLLNTYIAQMGTIYNPSNPKLLLSNLQSIYTNAFTHQEKVNSLIAPYAMAVDKRQALFEPLAKKITRLYKAYKTTEGITTAQLENFMAIARKLKGYKKTNTNTPTPAPTEENTQADIPAETTQRSTSQMSYDQRTNNYDLLISLLQNTPNYNPNEEEYLITTLQAEKTQMLQATQNVVNQYIPLNNARNNRNHSMYLSQDNLVDTFNKAKDYLFTILDSKSVQYKAIFKIKFKKAS